MRVLTAARVVVGDGETAEWLATIAALAERLRARGQQVWVFRSEGRPGEWLEFTEGKDDHAHRSRGPADEVEAALEARLRTLGRYDTSATDRWLAVPLGTRGD